VVKLMGLGEFVRVGRLPQAPAVGQRPTAGRSQVTTKQVTRIVCRAAGIEQVSRMMSS